MMVETLGLPKIIANVINLAVDYGYYVDEGDARNRLSEAIDTLIDWLAEQENLKSENTALKQRIKELEGKG